ncbi:hypothetical protein ECNE037_1413, partial [Escherichia coli NE037]
PGAVIMAFRLC